MNENPLYVAVRSLLTGRLPARGVSAQVKRSEQPTQQGVPSQATIFYTVVSNIRYGFEQRADVWNPTTESFDHVQSQQIETTLQFTALAPQNPADDAELTTTDMLNAAASIIGSDSGRAFLRSQGVAVLRIRDVRVVYSVDDRGQHKPNPSFDAVFTHRVTYVEQVPAVVGQEIEIHRV